VTDTLVSDIRNAALADSLVQFATERRSFRREDRVVRTLGAPMFPLVHGTNKR
jgi:hypothetical protein